MKHLHKIKPTFISIFSLNTDLFEMLDQTLFLVFDLLLPYLISFQIMFPTFLKVFFIFFHLVGLQNIATSPLHARANEVRAETMQWKSYFR